MYFLRYLNRGEVIHQEEYKTLEEIELKYQNEYHYEGADEYQIYDDEKDIEIEGNELFNAEDELGRMFDGDESMEGYDWNHGD